MNGFIPDPIWLIDMLKVDLKQLDRTDGVPEADVQLYEWALTLIGSKFPKTAQYALEAFQDVLSARMEEEKMLYLRHRPRELTQGMLMNLAAVSQTLQNEEERQKITRLTELVRQWPEQYVSRAAQVSSPAQSVQAVQGAPEYAGTPVAEDAEAQRQLQKAASEPCQEIKRR